MNTTQARFSPPGASGVHDGQPSHGLASKSIRPNIRRSDADHDPAEIGVAALLVGSIVTELVILAWILKGVV